MFRPLIMPGICAHHAMFTISSPYTQLSPSDLDSEIIPLKDQYQDLPRFPLSTLSTAGCHLPSPFLCALEMAVVVLFLVFGRKTGLLCPLFNRSKYCRQAWIETDVPAHAALFL